MKVSAAIKEVRFNMSTIGLNNKTAKRVSEAKKIAIQALKNQIPKKDVDYNFDRPIPQKGEKYRHFKLGKIVNIIGISRHTETEEISVVYEYEGHIWNRPLEMFMSEVDKEKYPDAKQRYRFEVVK